MDKIEEQLTNWNPVDKIIDTQYGNVTYLKYYKMDISRLMEGENNEREFVIKYADKQLEGMKEKVRCCATFEYNMGGIDDDATILDSSRDDNNIYRYRP